MSAADAFLGALEMALDEGSDEVIDRVLDKIARRRPDLFAVATPEVGGELLTAAQAAVRLGVSADYVRAHADELGVRRLGDGPRPRLRFDLAAVDAWATTCDARKGSAAPERPSRRGKRRPASPSAEPGCPLLPVGGPHAV